MNLMTHKRSREAHGSHNMEFLHLLALPTLYTQSLRYCKFPLPFLQKAERMHTAHTHKHTHASLSRDKYVLSVVLYTLPLYFVSLPVVARSWVCVCSVSTRGVAFTHLRIPQPSHLTRPSSGGLNSCDVFPLPLTLSLSGHCVLVCVCIGECLCDFHVCTQCSISDTCHSRKC